MNRGAGVAATALVAWLAASCPAPSGASPRKAGAPQGSSSGASRALTAGVVTLREPLTQMVRLPSAELELGSTVPEVLEAAGDCAREPLGERCSENTFENELPTRRVRVPAFYIDRTEVSVAAYERCAAASACRRGGYAAHPEANRKQLPASFVSYDDALAYCRYRGMRLPTEAEYERAARGASRRRYPWGQLYNRRLANHGRLGLDQSDDSDGYAELAPIGSFPDGRTPEGVYDLAGNVAEWTLDTAREASGGATLSGVRVLRGGHYQSAAPWLRGAARELADRELRVPFVGFRCARTARARPSAEP